MFYLFEFTKIGQYSKAIGENESTAEFIGIPAAHENNCLALSGLMVGSHPRLTSVGGTSR